jgi:hypothetical protein
MNANQIYEYSEDYEGDNKKDPNELTRKLKDKLIELRKPLAEKDSRAATIHAMYYSIMNFCNWHNILVNFTHLKKFLPKRPRKGRDRPYTKEQIIKMLKYCDERARLIILIFSTTGMREEALSQLRVSDIKRIPDDESLLLEGGAITVYSYDEDDSYLVFCTPECYNAYTDYLAKRAELGEVITDNSPVILRRIPKDRSIGWKEAETVSRTTISKILVNVATDAGVRKLNDKYQYSNHYISKVTVGFRKFAETTMIGARDEDNKHKMNPYIADSLIGHSRLGGIATAAHYDYSEKWYDYKRVIPDLTFSKEEEYKAKNDQLERRIEGTRQAESYIKQKELEMNERMQEMEGKLAELAKSNTGVYRTDSFNIPKDIYQDEDKFVQWLSDVRTGKFKPEVIGEKYRLIKPRNPDKLLSAYRQSPELFESIYRRLYNGFNIALNEAKKNKDHEKILEYSGKLESLKEHLVLVEKAKKLKS